MASEAELIEETCRQLLFALFCKEQLHPERGHIAEVNDIKSAFWTWFEWKRQFYNMPQFNDDHLSRCLFKQFYQKTYDNQMLNFRLVGGEELRALAQLRKSSI